MIDSQDSVLKKRLRPKLSRKFRPFDPIDRSYVPKIRGLEQIEPVATVARNPREGLGCPGRPERVRYDETLGGQ